MAYFGSYYDNYKKQVHIWDDEEGHVVIDHEPYAYAPNQNGDWKGIDGLTYKKVTEWSEEAETLGIVHEHNVPPVTRHLVDRYFETDEISDKNTILFFDIEVLKKLDGTYSDPDEAAGIINSAVFKVKGKGTYTCFVLDFNSKLSEMHNRKTIELPGKGEVNCDVFTLNSEELLLKKILDYWVETDPSIVSGWNINYFDVPYLCRRIENVLGRDYARRLSKINIVKERFRSSRYSFEIAGVAILDYLELYKNFPNKELSNYRLDTVAKEVLGRGKIEYEGDLDTLYKTNFWKFIMYNIVDVELIESMDDVLDHIYTAIGICHKGHVEYEAIYFSSRILDGASLTYCKNRGLVAVGNTQKWNRRAKGAFVKEPIPGIYKWIYDLDLTSLYPMNIITLNISPETKMALTLNWDEEEFAKGKTEKVYRVKVYKRSNALDSLDNMFDDTPKNDKIFKGSYRETDSFADGSYPIIEIDGHKNMQKFLEENNYSIASNGCMYDLSRPGLIPSILKTWFDERKEFKALRKKYENEGNDEKRAYYDRQQLITKILLNSFYGVLLLNSFRFYDLDNGEAVTLTGQSVIGWASKMTDVIYGNKFGKKSYVIYTDTDSIFCPLLPYLEDKFGEKFEEERTEKEIVDYSLEVINQVQDQINNSYKIYGKKLHNVDEVFWDLKQELIARRAMWIGKYDDKTYEVEGVKKRYAMWMVWEEGFPCKKIDIKGMDSVRSSWPKLFKKIQKEVLIDILNDKTESEMNEAIGNYKDEIMKVPKELIMTPTGLNNIKKYNSNEFNRFQKGTPIHVKAAIAYNQLLDKEGYVGHQKINDSIKILWCYLKKNDYGLKQLAIKGYDDPDKINQFVEGHIDRDLIFKKVLLKKLTSIWRSIGWGEIAYNSNINKFFEF